MRPIKQNRPREAVCQTHFNTGSKGKDEQNLSESSSRSERSSFCNLLKNLSESRGYCLIYWIFPACFQVSYKLKQ